MRIDVLICRSKQIIIVPYFPETAVFINFSFSTNPGKMAKVYNTETFLVKSHSQDFG